MFYKTYAMKLYEAKKLSSKHYALYVLMKRWFDLRNQGKDLGSFFRKRGFNQIAIYGMGEVGKRLAQELRNGPITIQYGIDRQDVQSENGLRIIKPDQPFDDVDLLVVTVVGDCEDIFELLSRKVSCPIVSIEDVIFAYDTSFLL